MIKYLGSKRKLVPHIVECVGSLPDVYRVVDLFTGTTRVAQAFKRLGYHVTANDSASYAHLFARAYIAYDATMMDAPTWQAYRYLIDKLNELPGYRGYVTRTYCEEARFFHPKNGARIDAIRTAIESALLTVPMEKRPAMQALLLTSLIEAADRVDSTTGVQMAYLKEWAPRALNDMELRPLDLIPGKGVAYNFDALDFVKMGLAQGSDLVYLDPPYNQHKYAGNYHIWETLARGDAPPTYGVARKRIDTRTNTSPFNSKRHFLPAFTQMVDGLAEQTKYLLVSFNNEGFITREQMINTLSRHGHVEVFDYDYKRYVGAQIGIHNDKGEKVGQVSHLRNIESLYLVRIGG